MKHLVAALILFAALPAMAQAPDPAGTALNQQWTAFTIQLENVQKALAAYVAEARAASARAAEAESRLQWVLENWVAQK